jgi:hypothetical protein
VSFCKIVDWERCGNSAAACVHFLAVSRFLKFAILNRGKSFRIWTSVPTPRAPLCIDPGGSMKGARRPEGSDRAAALPPQRPLRAAWGGCPAMAGRPSRRSDRCVATQFRLRRSCANPYGVPGGLAAGVASLTRSPPKASAKGSLRAAAKGAGDAVLDPEGWALWVTGLCLPLSS